MVREALVQDEAWLNSEYRRLARQELTDLVREIGRRDEEQERAKRELTRNGVDGVYAGDPDLIHVQNGKRAEIGRTLATVLDALMRDQAVGRTEYDRANQNLCPGCYMVVALDFLLALAERNGQPVTELARSMAGALEVLAAHPEYVEEIKVQLDPEDEE